MKKLCLIGMVLGCCCYCGCAGAGYYVDRMHKIEQATGGEATPIVDSAWAVRLKDGTVFVGDCKLRCGGVVLGDTRIIFKGSDTNTVVKPVYFL